MSIVFDILLGRPLMHSHGSSGIENGAITLIKMADMASASLIYRKTAGAGVPEVNTLATLKTDLVLVKADVGLGNVDNTTDAGKPVSTAQQTALDGKYTLQSANVVNESGADVDQRFEGDTDQNLLYLDASTDRVGIGIAIPTGKLHVQGASGSNILVIRTSSPSDALIIDQYGNVTTHQKLSVANPSAATGLLNVNGGSSSNAGTAGFFMKGVGSQISPYINIVNSASAALFNINSSGNVGIGTTGPTTALDIDSSARSVGNLRQKVLEGQNIFQWVNDANTTIWRAVADSSNIHHYLGAGATGRNLYYNLNGQGFIIDGNGIGGFLKIANSAAFLLDSPPAGGVNLISINDNSYATAGAPLTTVNAMKIGTWAWNGSNGYSISSQTFLRQTQLSAADNDARFDIADFNTPRLSILLSSGNVGISTTTPSSILAFGGNSARVVSLERHTTADRLGSNLSLVSGGATVGATDKNGGNLLLNSGIATGTGFSSVKLQAVTAGGTGTTDRTVTTHFEVGNSKIAFYGSTPVVKATALTAIDASALNTGDATSDTVINNMRTRINELETKLQAYGLLT